MVPDDSIVFLFDVDNTLLDNDALKADLSEQLDALLGPARSARFWELYEAVRHERGVVDLPLTLERFAPLAGDPTLAERARAVLMGYPFASRLFPATPAAVAHARTLGTPAILSDGDAVFQPYKIARSGLAAEVAGRVLVFEHKVQHLAEVMAAWPAALYVAVDDRAPILAALVRQQPQRVVTVHVHQGHYADDPPDGPPPDVSLAGIGDLRGLAASDLWRLARR
jgi:FMN phosphatase YigB (HAD superfamily)